MSIFKFAEHGSCRYYTPSGKKVSGASIYFESLSYKVNPMTGYIDYEKLEERAVEFHPRILICGGSSYPREWDFARLRKIADRCGAVLMCDMAHISGLVAAKVWKLNCFLFVGLWHIFYSDRIIVLKILE
jgi:glycine hydroxymethyltransferase